MGGLCILLNKPDDDISTDVSYYVLFSDGNRW